MSRLKSVLVVGVGSIGERHLRCFASTGRAELSLCEVNPELRATVAERYHVEHAYGSLDEALGAGPDAVLICTPAHLHIPMAMKAAKAGAHLFIEKPLSTTLAGVDALQAEIERQGLVASVGYVFRAHPIMAAMQRALASGQFGEPVQVVATCGQNFPFYRPAYRDTYYKDRATGGGAVQDALTHIINDVEWLIGPVDRLIADAAHQVLEGVEVEDTVHVLTRHGGVMGSFSLNQYQPPNEITVTVNCRRGIARFEFHNNRWRWMTEPDGQWHDEAINTLERDELFTLQAQAFLDAVDGLKPPLCTLAEAAQTLRVNLAILASAESGSWQAVQAREAVHD